MDVSTEPSGATLTMLSSRIRSTGSSERTAVRQQRAARAGPPTFADLGQRARLHFDGHLARQPQARQVRTHGAYSVHHAARRGDVVVLPPPPPPPQMPSAQWAERSGRRRGAACLDEDHVVQPDAVVRATAHEHGHLVQHAEAWRSLARVENLGGVVACGPAPARWMSGRLRRWAGGQRGPHRQRPPCGAWPWPLRSYAA